MRVDPLGFAMPACIVLLAGALLPDDLAVLLEYQREAVLRGELWRLWTGHLVHFTAAQALWDGLACLVPAVWLWRAGEGKAVAVALGLAAPLVGLALLGLVPDMAVYRGASALAVTLSVAGLHVAWRLRPDLHAPLLACALLLLAKLVGESQGWGIALADLPVGVEVAWQAHWAGLVCSVPWLLARQGPMRRAPGP
jgi:hypothetical protein